MKKKPQSTQSPEEYRAQKQKERDQKAYHDTKRDAKIYSDRAHEHSKTLPDDHGNHDMASKDHKLAANTHKHAAEAAKAVGDHEAAKHHEEQEKVHRDKVEHHDTLHSKFVNKGKKVEPETHSSEEPHESHKLYKPHTGEGIPHWARNKTHREVKATYRHMARELHPDMEQDPKLHKVKAKAFNDFHRDYEKAKEHPHFPKPTQEDIALEGMLENFDRLAYDKYKGVY